MTALLALRRIAWRSAVRNKRRSLLVILLIAVLVGVGTVVATVVRTTVPSSEDSADSWFGQAELAVNFGSQLYVTNPYGRYGDYWSSVYVAQDENLKQIVAESPDYDTVEEWNAAVEELREIERQWVATFDHAAFVAQLEERMEVPVLASRIGPPGVTLGWAEGSNGSLSDIDLADPMAEGILTLVRGRLPAKADEVVVTAYPSERELVELGSSVEIGGQTFTIVGVIVEPSSKYVSAAVTTPAGFDRVVTDEIDRTYRYRFARRDSSVSIESESLRFELAELAGRPRLGLVLRDDLRFGPDDSNIANSPVQLSSIVTALLGAQIALVAMSAFTVGVRRRTVEFGQLLTTGADDRQIRRLVLVEAILLGATGAVAGALIGAGVTWWIAEQGWLIDLGDRYAPSIRWVPLDWIGPAVVGIAASAAAAWWPARSISRLPVTDALAGRLPTSAPRGRTTLWGVVALVVGTGLVAVTLKSSNPANTGVLDDELSAFLFGCALVVGFGLMFIGAVAGIGQIISFFGGRADALSLKLRLILRNSDRQRSRAWAAVAAFVVILGAPVMVASALAAYPNAVPNERQILLYDSPHHQSGPVSQVPVSLGPTQSIAPIPVAELVAEPFAPGVGIEEAVSQPDPVARAESMALFVDRAVDEVDDVLGVRHAAPIVQPNGLYASVLSIDRYGTWATGAGIAVATPELLNALDIDSDARRALDQGAAVWIGQNSIGQRPVPSIAIRTTDDPLPPDTDDVRALSITPFDQHGRMQAWSGPSVLISEATATELGAELVDVGMLMVAAEPISSADSRTLNDRLLAAVVDLEAPQTHARAFEVGRDSTMLRDTEIRFLVVGGSLLIALLIALITAALAAVEVDREIGSMVASGAPPSLRRWLLGGQTVYHLAIAGVIATPLTLLIFWTIQYSNPYAAEHSIQVPYSTIAIVVVGIPLLAGLMIAALFRSGSPAISRRLS